MKTLFNTEPTMPELRALTWKEPFASLMMWCKVGTRTWSTDYRGLVLICAGKTPYNKRELFALCGERQMKRVEYYKTLETFKNNEGKAIGIAELWNCRPMKPSDENACFVQYKPGLYCHFYKNIRAIEHMPYKGQQGWKKLAPEFWEKITLKS
ncbi:MAG: hypothetical protein AAFZ15_32375 [Bacteroidota bacterium]